MTDILPTADEIVGAALDELVAQRPTVQRWLDVGTYGTVVRGLKSQAALAARYLAALVVSKRASLATGADLLDLLHSEFDTLIDPSPTKAVGDLTLTRTGTGAGVIKKGSKFTRQGNGLNNPLAFASSQYETIEDVYVGVGVTSVPLKIRASQAGAAANHVLYIGQPLKVSIDTPLFDSTFLVADNSLHLAGGSDVAGDDYARAIAKAYARGQYAPVNEALIYAALASGARHVSYREDTSTGEMLLAIADSSWASSDAWISDLTQRIVNADEVGFGCKFTVHRADNLFIHVSADVMLRDAQYMTDTTEVTAAIQAAVRAYFDDRPDWDRWTYTGLRAAISRAHDYVLHCSSAAVKRYPDELVITPPTGPTGTHLYLADNSCTLTYSAPS